MCACVCVWASVCVRACMTENCLCPRVKPSEQLVSDPGWQLDWDTSCCHSRSGGGNQTKCWRGELTDKYLSILCRGINPRSDEHYIIFVQNRSLDGIWDVGLPVLWCPLLSKSLPLCYLVVEPRLSFTSVVRGLLMTQDSDIRQIQILKWLRTCVRTRTQTHTQNPGCQTKGYTWLRLLCVGGLCVK